VFATTASAGATAGEVTKVLLDRALVVGVGPSTTAPQAEDSSQANEEQLPRAILTLALMDDEAAKLVYGSQHGSLYLGLLNEKSNVSSTTEVSQRTLFG
jgi:pilus assembly protein CpaB